MNTLSAYPMMYELDFDKSDFSLFKLNNGINNLAYFLRRSIGITVLGAIGLVLFLPLLLFLFLYTAFSSKRTRKRVLKAHKYLVELLSDEASSEFISNKRTVMRAQAELASIILSTEAMRNSREPGSNLITGAFIKKEDVLLKKMKWVNNDLKDRLYPNTNKQYTQEELEAMSYRSQGVPDLDDQETDRLMELYA